MSDADIRSESFPNPPERATGADLGDPADGDADSGDVADPTSTDFGEELPRAAKPENRVTGAVKTATARIRPPHLYEIDVVRILTFACVIAVHVTSHTVAPHDVPLYIFLGLVHYTREVFFALSSFVLVYTFIHRPEPMRKFWPRRFLLVGIPYLVWSAIYRVASYIVSPSATGTPLDLLWKYLFDVATGAAWFHLYFLLVTMQVYLLMPVIMWVVRRTARHHWTLLIVAFVFQLLLTAFYQWWPHLPYWLTYYNKQVFISYVFFILLGAVGAYHWKTFVPWVAAHRRPIAIVTVATGLLTIGIWAIQVALGKSLYSSGNPLQPSLMLWSVAIGLGWMALGSYWSEHRDPNGWLSKVVAYASRQSFGIFLSHPLVLYILGLVGGGIIFSGIPKPWLTLVVYIGVVAGAVLIADVFSRTPLSLALTGRRFTPRKKKPQPEQPARR